MTTTPYHLFRATSENTEDIVTLLKQSFLAAYPDLYTADDVQEYFALNYTAGRVEEWLSSPLTHILLAQHNGQLQGLLVFHHKESASAPGTAAIEIDKLYLMPSAHGTGLAATLLRKIEEETEDINLHWLLVAQKNIRAQRFYSKHGFKVIKDGPGLIVGKEHAASFVMHKHLN